MADIKKLIYKLKTEGELTDNITIEISDLELLDDAADALEQLLAENEKLRAENIMHHNAADNYYAELTEYRQERNEALAELEQVKAERDAAISDLETIMAYGGDNTDTCQYCKNVQCYARGGTKLCLPQWRGKKED